MVVVTNQSGIARGYFDLPTLERIHARFHELLAAERVGVEGDQVDGRVGQGFHRPGVVGIGVGGHGLLAHHPFEEIGVFLVHKGFEPVEFRLGTENLVVQVDLGSPVAASVLLPERTQADLVAAWLLPTTENRAAGPAKKPRELRATPDLDIDTLCSVYWRFR